MSEAPKKPAIQSPARQRQIREAAALRANLLKRKDQSRLREAAKDLPDQPGIMPAALDGDKG